LFGTKKLSIMSVAHDGLYALLKSKHITAYLLHAQSIRKGNIASVVNEKIIHEEPDSIEDKSVEMIGKVDVATKRLTVVPGVAESTTQCHDILPTRK
jgi:hypothetical protein